MKYKQLVFMIVTMLGVFSCLEGRLWSEPTTSDGDWAARFPPSRSGPHQGTPPGHWGHRGSEVRGSRIIILAALHLQAIKYTITDLTLNGYLVLCVVQAGFPDLQILLQHGAAGQGWFGPREIPHIHHIRWALLIHRQPFERSRTKAVGVRDLCD